MCVFAENRTGNVYKFPEMQFYLLGVDPLQLSFSGTSGITPDPAFGGEQFFFFYFLLSKIAMKRFVVAGTGPLTMRLGKGNQSRHGVGARKICRKAGAGLGCS